MNMNSRPISKYYIALILLIYASCVAAQLNGIDFLVKQPLNFKSITAQDGLSQNWIRCIYQDNQGFMWFGASGGINRYDGNDIKTYSLGNVNVNAITRKSDHELWIGNDLGVCIYDQNEDTFRLFHHLREQTILSIIQDTDGVVWFGTNTGLYRYNALQDSLYGYFAEVDNKSAISNNYINTLFIDSRKNLWIGTKTGLNMYLRDSDAFVNYRASSTQGLSGNDIMAICEDHVQRLWVGTAKDGLNIMYSEGNAVQFKKIADGAIVSLLVDLQNTLWVGTSSSGGILQIDLNRFSIREHPEIIRIKKNRNNPQSLSDNSVFCIYEDKWKDIWVGTFGGGVNYFSYRSKKFNSVKEGIHTEPLLSNDLVNAVWEDRQYLWLGTEGGLDRYDKQTKKTSHFHYEGNALTGLSSDPVYAIYGDRLGNLWIGTWTGGLNLFNYHTNTFTHFKADGKPGSISSENVISIYEDSRGFLWIGTVGGGVNRYDRKSGLFTTFRHDRKNQGSLYSDIVHDIKEMTDGRLLVASYGSLDIYDYSKNRFIHNPLQGKKSGALNSRFIITIFEDSRKNIWLGTNDGLMLYRENSIESVVYSMSDGLAGNTIQGIIEDDKGNLWITTNSGLSKFNGGVFHPQTPAFTNFGEQDGLPGKEFKRRALFRNQSGFIYAGTSQGMCYFHPDSISLNRLPPEVVFADIELLQFGPDETSKKKQLIGNINVKNKIVLPYNKTDFVISFSALNFLNGEKNEYKYMLNGYDPDWVYSGNHHIATYKNLKPGRYTFMVLGSNNDKVWSTVTKTLQIYIAPPFWKTWWFYSIMIISVCCILFLLFTWRVNTITREKRKLEKLVSDRTLELKDANIKLEEQSEELINQNEELRMNQEQLSLYKDHLEELVKIRTAELEMAKNKAEESDRLKSSFLANMSHEIRTPLNAITGFIQFFDDRDLDINTRRTYQRIIQSNSESLLHLIDDILDISTIEANQLKVKITEFAPHTIIQDLYHQFLPLMPQTVQLKMSIPDSYESATIRSDEYRFRQILSNLLSNALKFTESGSIEMGYYPDSKKMLVFYVKDTGIGISRKDQKIIFNYFTKIENSNRLFRGVGLGLSISKHLTELLGGSIRIESEPGIGSTFFFTQPRG